MSFLSSVVTFVHLYAAEHQVTPDAVTIRMTLSDGSQFETAGVSRIELDSAGVAFIRGKASGASLIIDDSRTLHVQVDLGEPIRPIGFLTETHTH